VTHGVVLPDISMGSLKAAIGQDGPADDCPTVVHAGRARARTAQCTQILELTVVPKKSPRTALPECLANNLPPSIDGLRVIDRSVRLQSEISHTPLAPDKRSLLSVLRRQTALDLVPIVDT